MSYRTYDESLLGDFQLTDGYWARTWVRLWLRDKPEIQVGEPPAAYGQPLRPSEATWPSFSRTDAELEAALKLDSVTDGTVAYFRPHFTAARLYLGDPNIWRSRAVEGTSESRRDPREVIGAWLAQGRAFDLAIPSTINLPPFDEVAPVSEVASDSSGFLSVVVGGL